MSINNYKPHVWILPEDRADEQIANGFVYHDQVNHRQIKVMPVAKGWPRALDILRTDYIPSLQINPRRHVVIIIDFDGQYASRRQEFDDVVPADLKSRVFVIGARENPEVLKQSFARDFELIGRELAENCFNNVDGLWSHEHLNHNEPDRERLTRALRPILFSTNAN